MFLVQLMFDFDQVFALAQGLLAQSHVFGHLDALDPAIPPGIQSGADPVGQLEP